VNPRWRHIFMTSWDLPARVQVAATWRYMGKVKLDQNTSNPTLQFATFGQPDLFNARIPAYSWLDLSGSWNFRDNMQLRLGVLNVFDKNPPLVTSEITAGGDANTYSVYDQLGRQIFAAVSMNF
jgi:outer membrane receptor protein involved in Fe transport